MKLLNKIRQIKQGLSTYRPSIEVLISKANLLHNLREYQKKYPRLKFAPVLKSNAYGHGLVEVAEILDDKDIAFFVLDSLHEAMILRQENIRSKILVIGFTQSDNIVKSKLKNTSFTVTSFEQLRELAQKLVSPIKIHLKIDTGMHRQGIQIDQLDEAIKIVKGNQLFELEGLCSHFADADNADDIFTKKQIDTWSEVVGNFKNNFTEIKYFHIAASAGTFFASQTFANVARLGLSLYGIKSSPKADLDLRPVMEINSIISSIKKIPAGEGIGYNLTFKAPTEMTAATIPMGYFEGVDRRLSNNGFFKINNSFCLIIGRVSMNISSIDISAVPNPKLGQKVNIISADPADLNSIEIIAEKAKTIPYEILVNIPQSLRRTVVDK